MTTAPPPAQSDPHRSESNRQESAARTRQGFRTVLASWIGTTIEYYDFAIYGLAASVIFAKVFFP
ncbi:MAG: hypothetical protein J2P19_28050, partial [Pseudonocardia sp.]|nr:hypothetical protein [Pseudonocardia sp.]